MKRNLFSEPSKTTTNSDVLSLSAALTLSEHVGASLSLEHDEESEKQKRGTPSVVSRSNDIEQVLVPSLMLANKGSEVVLSWRAPMAKVQQAGYFKALGLVTLKGSNYMQILLERSLIRGLGDESKDPTAIGLGVGRSGRERDFSALVVAHEKVGVSDNPGLHLEAFGGYSLEVNTDFHIDNDQFVGLQLFWEKRYSEFNDIFKIEEQITGIGLNYLSKF